MVSSFCGRPGFGERQRGTTCTVWRKLFDNFLHTVNVVPRCRSPNPCLPQQQDTIPYAVKISVLRSWRWAKYCPKHVEQILLINKLLLHLVGCSILLYLHWWCTVKHKSYFRVFKTPWKGMPQIIILYDYNLNIILAILILLNKITIVNCELPSYIPVDKARPHTECPKNQFTESPISCKQDLILLPLMRVNWTRFFLLTLEDRFSNNCCKFIRQ